MMKGVTRARREVQEYLNYFQVSGAKIEHCKGKNVIIIIPLTESAYKFFVSVKNHSPSNINCSNGNGMLKIKAPSLNYLKNFFRRDMPPREVMTLVSV